MKVVLVGVQDFNFPTDDGGIIDGVKLHYIEEFKGDDNSFGFCTGSRFVARDNFNNFGLSVEGLKSYIHAEIDVEFNSKARLVGVYLPSAPKKA